MFSIGNDEPEVKRTVHTGDQIVACPHCGGEHILTGGVNMKTGGPTDMLLTYTCGGKTYLAAIDNKLLP